MKLVVVVGIVEKDSNAAMLRDRVVGEDHSYIAVGCIFVIKKPCQFYTRVRPKDVYIII